MRKDFKIKVLLTFDIDANRDPLGDVESALQSAAHHLHETLQGTYLTDVLVMAPPPDNIWAEDPNHPVAQWQYEVENDDTRHGYWDWVASQEEQEQECSS